MGAYCLLFVFVPALTGSLPYISLYLVVPLVIFININYLCISRKKKKPYAATCAPTHASSLSREIHAPSFLVCDAVFRWPTLQRPLRRALYPLANPFGCCLDLFGSVWAFFGPIWLLYYRCLFDWFLMAYSDPATTMFTNAPLIPCEKLTGFANYTTWAAAVSFGSLKTNNGEGLMNLLVQWWNFKSKSSNIIC